MPSSLVNCLANITTLIMLIRVLVKYNVFSSSSVCTDPPLSFHVHFTMSIPAGRFNFPPIVTTMLWKWQKYLCYCKCECLLSCHKPRSLHWYQIYYCHLISWPCHQLCMLKWMPLFPNGCILSFSFHAACFYESISKAWVEIVYLSGLRLYTAVSPSICLIWGS